MPASWGAFYNVMTVTLDADSRPKTPRRLTRDRLRRPLGCWYEHSAEEENGARLAGDDRRCTGPPLLDRRWRSRWRALPFRLGRDARRATPPAGRGGRKRSSRVPRRRSGRTRGSPPPRRRLPTAYLSPRRVTAADAPDRPRPAR